MMQQNTEKQKMGHRRRTGRRVAKIVQNPKHIYTFQRFVRFID